MALARSCLSTSPWHHYRPSCCLRRLRLKLRKRARCKMRRDVINRTCHPQLAKTSGYHCTEYDHSGVAETELNRRLSHLEVSFGLRPAVLPFRLSMLRRASHFVCSREIVSSTSNTNRWSDSKSFTPPDNARSSFSSWEAMAYGSARSS